MSLTCEAKLILVKKLIKLLVKKLIKLLEDVDAAIGGSSSDAVLGMAGGNGPHRGPQPGVDAFGSAAINK